MNYARKDPQKFIGRWFGSRLFRTCEAIKTWGKELGFQQVRVADANADMAQLEYGLQQWLNEGHRGEIDYMAKHGTPRTRPAELVPGTLVVSVRMNYMPVVKDSWQIIHNGNKAIPFPLCARP